MVLQYLPVVVGLQVLEGANPAVAGSIDVWLLLSRPCSPVLPSSVWHVVSSYRGMEQRVPFPVIALGTLCLFLTNSVVHSIPRQHHTLFFYLVCFCATYLIVVVESFHNARYKTTNLYSAFFFLVLQPALAFPSTPSETSQACFCIISSLFELCALPPFRAHDIMFCFPGE